MSPSPLHITTEGLVEPIIWPVLEVVISYANEKGVVDWVVPACRFHALTEEDENHLAGMGTALVGNTIRAIAVMKKNVDIMTMDARLLLRRHPADKGLLCPWPGMPDAAPLPLNLDHLPYDYEMMLDDEGDMRKTLDRQTFTKRLREHWVPWLVEQLHRS